MNIATTYNELCSLHVGNQQSESLQRMYTIYDDIVLTLTEKVGPQTNKMKLHRQQKEDNSIREANEALENEANKNNGIAQAAKERQIH